MGKNGFFIGVGEGGGGIFWRYFRFGEKSFMISGYIFFFSWKLNFLCYKNNNRFY